MREDDEYILARLCARNRVHERLLDIRMIHVQIATENTPENALECGQAGTLDCTSDKSDVLS